MSSSTVLSVAKKWKDHAIQNALFGHLSNGPSCFNDEIEPIFAWGNLYPAEDFCKYLVGVLFCEDLRPTFAPKKEFNECRLWVSNRRSYAATTLSDIGLRTESAAKRRQYMYIKKMTKHLLLIKMFMEQRIDPIKNGFYYKTYEQLGFDIQKGVEFIENILEMPIYGELSFIQGRRGLTLNSSINETLFINTPISHIVKNRSSNNKSPSREVIMKSLMRQGGLPALPRIGEQGFLAKHTMLFLDGCYRRNWILGEVNHQDNIRIYLDSSTISQKERNLMNNGEVVAEHIIDRVLFPDRLNGNIEENIWVTAGVYNAKLPTCRSSMSFDDKIEVCSRKILKITKETSLGLGVVSNRIKTIRYETEEQVKILSSVTKEEKLFAKFLSALLSKIG